MNVTMLNRTKAGRLRLRCRPRSGREQPVACAWMSPASLQIRSDREGCISADKPFLLRPHPPGDCCAEATVSLKFLLQGVQTPQGDCNGAARHPEYAYDIRRLLWGCMHV